MLKLMRKHLNQAQKGFTLIELLIVVAIIGILAAIAIPNLITAQRRARYSRAAGDTKTIMSQAMVLTSDNNKVAVAACALGGGVMPFCLWDGKAPNGVRYMAQVMDVWMPQTPLLPITYAFSEVNDTGCALGPGCVVYASNTGGNDATQTVWDGIALITADDLGNSTIQGCVFGKGTGISNPC